MSCQNKIATSSNNSNLPSFFQGSTQSNCALKNLIEIILIALVFIILLLLKK